MSASERTSGARRLALLALVVGAQALVPVPAAAMDGVVDGSGCQPGMRLPPGIGINEANEICTYEVGGGTDRGPLGVGYGGGGGSATPAPVKPVWMPGEVSKVVQDRDPYCRVWPEHCKRSVNGRPSQSIKRDRDTNTGGGAGHPAKGKPVKGKAPAGFSAEEKKAECRGISNTLNSKNSLEYAKSGKTIEELLKDDPHATDGVPEIAEYFAEIRKRYQELKELVRQWNSRSLGCSDLLKEKLRAVYDRMP